MSNEKYFLKDIVIIIKEYPLFGLTKVRFKNNNDIIIIDSNLITSKSEFEKTLSIKILMGAQL